MNKTPVTPEWLEAQGFRREPMLGYVKDVGDGPGDGDNERTTLSICVGTYPFNVMCCSLCIAGFGIVTNAHCQEDIEVLIRLLNGSRIDHPHVAEYEDGDLDEEDEFDPEHDEVELP